MYSADPHPITHDTMRRPVKLASELSDSGHLASVAPWGVHWPVQFMFQRMMTYCLCYTDLCLYTGNRCSDVDN